MQAKRLELRRCASDRDCSKHTRAAGLDGVVRNGKIEGAGGWCASGFMNAWKEAMEAPAQEVKSEASAVAAPAQGENEEKPMSASEIVNLVDKLAHFSTFEWTEARRKRWVQSF